MKQTPTPSHDPFAISSQLQREYLGYLRDALPVHPNQPRLRRLIDEKIDQPDAFARQPLISAIPAWKPDQTPRQLLKSPAAPRFHPEMAAILTDQIDRPLYAHQVQAIKRVQDGRNLVVATGTGSGKTECFLLPLIDAALRSREPVGVQAIFIYPMNALANDQLGRMRELLGDRGVTFGRYTSQTPRDELPEDSAERVCPNERLTRPEIRDQPPQLLLTNFAMLEYLLLRPDDQQIFRHDRVHTIVLDEAHSYRGAQGIDISLLMRRLRHRFGGKLRFILTSATIGDDGPDADARIAEFADRLTGSGFDAQDVIRGTPTSPFEGQSLRPIPADALDHLNHQLDPPGLTQLLNNAAEASAWVKSLGIVVAAEDPHGMLFEALRQSAPMAELHDRVIARPTTVKALAEALGHSGHAVTEHGVERLLLLAANVRSPISGSPLFSARVHHFFRGLQGASVVLNPNADESGGEDRIVEQVVMKEDAQADGEAQKWPLFVCHACGMPAVAARQDSHGSFTPAHPAATDQVTLLTWMPAWRLNGGDEPTAEDEQDDDLSPRDSQSDFGTTTLRPLPGADAQGNLKTCPCCAARAGQFDSVMRRFSTGEDAPTAVLAEELLRQLPPDPEKLDQPAAGRKLLAFSDSRQRAAFFAPYLARTIADASFVQPLAAVVAQAEADGQPLSLAELPAAARDLAMQQPWVIFRHRNDQGVESYQIKASDHLNQADRRGLRMELAVGAYQHLTARPAQRNRLPALMVAAPQIDLTPAMQQSIDDALGELLPDPAIASDLVQRLLCIMLRRYAVNFGSLGIDRRHLIGGKLQGPTAAAFHRNPPSGKQLASQPTLSRWNPFEAPPKRRKQTVAINHQVDQVRKALGAAQLDPADDQRINEILSALWIALIDPASGLLEDMGQGRFRLDAGHVLVRRAGPWFRCSRCDARGRHLLGGTCEVFGCDGRLVEVQDPDAERALSRLVQRYSRAPLPVNVKEHTAQLTLDKGRQYQEDFTAGRVNVLSCSTTFEMGVDVGSLDTVFLRNVPRTTANYVQRAGRAGRRNQALAHAVTFAHATPHDQHHYFQPADIAAGRVPVPVVYTANPVLTQRHVNAYLLGQFWPTLPKPTVSTGRSWKTANADGDNGFFSTDPGDMSSPAAQFVDWARDRLDTLGDELAAMLDLPALEIDGPAMVEASCRQLIAPETDDPDSRGSVWAGGLLRPWKGFMAQAHQLDAEANAAWNNRDPKVQRRASTLRHQADRARRIADELCDQDLIGFLSAHHWLPNYAFPQDTVRLLVRQDVFRDSLRLERDRAMAIIDYAPGAQVIVDGSLIESAALELEKRVPVLRHFQQLTHGRVKLFPPGASDLPHGPTVVAYLEPRGFSTQVNDPIEPPNLYRKRPAPNTPVFLVDGAPAEAFEPCPDLPGVYWAIQRSATLFTANLGPLCRGRPVGYRLCLQCGSKIETGAGGTHHAPWGSECRGRYESIALAHRFETTVLQLRFSRPAAPQVEQSQPFWRTLATAVGLAAGETLDIERGDLRVDFRSQIDEADGGELFLYDNIPGGAGYAQSVQRHLPRVIQRTLDRLARCSNPDCLPESSCYACLRSYENQYHWMELCRQEPLKWLKDLLRSNR